MTKAVNTCYMSLKNLVKKWLKGNKHALNKLFVHLNTGFRNLCEIINFFLRRTTRISYTQYFIAVNMK